MADEEAMARGAAMIETVYGFKPEWDRTPLSERTVGELFGGVWTRPGLSVRDRRLLVLGVAATLDRADLIEVQVRGALLNGEIEPEQIDEIILHLAYYVGWPKVSAIQKGAYAALASVRAKPAPADGAPEE